MMKKFFLKLVLFVLFIILMDIIAGKLFSYMIDHTRGGDTKRNNYICNEVLSNILIFGSSRAQHHYNPLIISDSLGMSCYNCGQDGNGAILNYGRYNLICQRYHPKFVIFDVTPGFDLLSREDNHKFLGWLRAFYDREGISDIFNSVDPCEKYKMMSQMYRYNSRFVQIVSDFIYPMHANGIMGFTPFDQEMDTMKIPKNQEKVELKFDSIKIKYIEKMINESSDTKILFVVSPHWSGMDSVQFVPINNLCKKYNLLFYNFSNSSKYVHNNYFFMDDGHLNAIGADEFTRDLVIAIKNSNLLVN